VGRVPVPVLGGASASTRSGSRPGRDRPLRRRPRGGPVPHRGPLRSRRRPSL